MHLESWRVQFWGSAAATLLALSLTGCGGSAPTAESQPEPPAPEPAAAAIEAAPDEESPQEVVSRFLDGVRRGGAAADVGRLMTQKAREQYGSVGLVMQPIGAPDATFEVTRSVPYGEDGALVNSLWTEKDPSGETITYQVGWALKREPDGWRVSGLILEDDPEPRVLNFESREDVLAIKQSQQGLEAAPADPPAAPKRKASRCRSSASGRSTPPAPLPAVVQPPG